MTPRYTAAERLDRIPAGRFHRRILWLIGGGMFLDNFDSTLSAGVLGSLTAEHWSTLSLNASFISATFAGMTLGTFWAGILGDRFGRRFTYQANLLIIGITSLAAALAPSMQWLIAFRFVMGLGLGAETVIGYSTMAEFVPPGVRGRWVAYLAIITNVAVAASGLAAYFVIPKFGWRLLFALAGLGALLVWWARKRMPESPRWLEAVGRHEEADAVLAAIERESGGVLPDPKRTAGSHSTPSKVSLTVLFSKAVRSRTLLGSWMAVTTNIGLYGFLTWLPTFLVVQKLGVSSSLRYTMFMSLGAPFGPALASIIADRMGRRWGLSAFAAVAAVVGMAYAAAPTMLVATVAGFFLYLLMYLVATLGQISYIPELFPTAYRLRGAGFCISIGRIAAALTPFAVVWGYAQGGVTLLLSVLGGMLIVLSAAVAIWGVDTSRRPLESVAPESIAKLMGAVAKTAESEMT